MMWDDLVECENPNCKYPKALHHESSGNEVNWTACPKCRKYYEHGVEIPPEENDPNKAQFWDNVEHDTGWSSEGKFIPCGLTIVGDKPLTEKDAVDSTIKIPQERVAGLTIPIIHGEWKNKKAYLVEDVQSAKRLLIQRCKKLWEGYNAEEIVVDLEDDLLPIINQCFQIPDGEDKNGRQEIRD